MAELLQSGSPVVSWLPRLFAQQGLSVNDGLLVQLQSVPEQAGEQFLGTWLTGGKEFWEFSIVVSRRSAALLEVEQFSNITHSTVVSAHVPGTGPSFGYLTLQAFRAAYGG